MTRLRHIYLFSMLGLLGGVIAAILHQLFLVDPILRSVGTPAFWQWNVLLGICIGAPIAFAPRFADTIGHHDWREALRSGAVAAAFGALGGMVAVLGGEWLHRLLGGGYVGRIGATALLGVAIGCAEIWFSGARRWRAVAGGAAGGAIAGFLVELLVSRPEPYRDSAIIALLLLGLAIPLAISLAVHLRPEAWLEGITGPKVAGQVYHLGKFNERDLAVIGSGDRSFVWIRGAEPSHAELYIAPDGTRLRHIARSGETLVNGSPIRECVLRDRDEIEIGNSVLQYKERARVEAHAAQPRVRFVGKGMSAVLLLATSVPITLAQGSNYTATIVDLDSEGRQVSGHVVIKDDKGNPLSASQRARLIIFENGVQVAERQISEGRIGSSVLVIDRSGSMRGPKLASAREAAAAYVRQAPPGHQIMVIAFDAAPRIECGFSSDKSQLAQCVSALQYVPRGRTALLDAVKTALAELSSREGTRSVLALTDGIDNASVTKAPDLAAAARDAETAVSVVGLGADARAASLQTLVTEGGSYLTAATPEELAPLFRTEAGLLSARHPFRYTSSRPPEGSRRNVSARAEIYSGESVTVVVDDDRYVARLFIPGLKGDLRPYLASVGGLLLIPVIVSVFAAFMAVRRFRESQLQYVATGSPLVGIRDANDCVLAPGDYAVECPMCNRAHHVRSWRNNRCRCMREPKGSGTVCYQRLLPGFVRHWLDTLSGGHTTTRGRKWLCRCAGDDEGY